MTRHDALHAALEELTAALEDPSLDDGVTWLDVQDAAGDPRGAPSDEAASTDGDAATRRAVLEELRGL